MDARKGGFPSLGVEDGWEIELRPGNPNRLLADLLRLVPDGAVLLLEDSLEPADRELLWPCRVYWSKARWSGAETMAIGIYPESRAAVLNRIGAVDLGKHWMHVCLFRGDGVYFESHDYIRTNAFVTSAVDAAVIQSWVTAGTVTAANRFVPDKTWRQ